MSKERQNLEEFLANETKTETKKLISVCREIESAFKLYNRPQIHFCTKEDADDMAQWFATFLLLKLKAHYDACINAQKQNNLHSFMINLRVIIELIAQVYDVNRLIGNSNINQVFEKLSQETFETFTQVASIYEDDKKNIPTLQDELNIEIKELATAEGINTTQSNKYFLFPTTLRDTNLHRLYQKISATFLSGKREQLMMSFDQGGVVNQDPRFLGIYMLKLMNQVFPLLNATLGMVAAQIETTKTHIAELPASNAHITSSDTLTSVFLESFDKLYRLIDFYIKKIAPPKSTFTTDFEYADISRKIYLHTTVIHDHLRFMNIHACMSEMRVILRYAKHLAIDDDTKTILQQRFKICSQFVHPKPTQLGRHLYHGGMVCEHTDEAIRFLTENCFIPLYLIWIHINSTYVSANPSDTASINELTQLIQDCDIQALKKPHPA